MRTWAVSIWLLVAYVAAYLAMLRPWMIVEQSLGGVGVGHREVDYQFGGKVAHIVFKPAHSIDRAIRPDYWNNCSTLDE